MELVWNVAHSLWLRFFVLRIIYGADEWSYVRFKMEGIALQYRVHRIRECLNETGFLICSDDFSNGVLIFSLCLMFFSCR